MHIADASLREAACCRQAGHAAADDDHGGAAPWLDDRSPDPAALLIRWPREGEVPTQAALGSSVLLPSTRPMLNCSDRSWPAAAAPSWAGPMQPLQAQPKMPAPGPTAAPAPAPASQRRRSWAGVEPACTARPPCANRQQRHFSRRWALRELVSDVLTFDYLGALLVALDFPLLFVPQLGLVRTGLFFGLLNVAVVAWALCLFRAELRRFSAHLAACIAVAAVLIAAMAGADHLTTWAEDRSYGDDIMVRESSDYQRVVVTAGSTGVRLFLRPRTPRPARRLRQGPPGGWRPARWIRPRVQRVAWP